MDIPFTKAQALSNDFVIAHESVCEETALSSFSQNIANRRLGIGCDQVIYYKSTTPHEFHIRFFNADGSEAEACGNGTRAFALFAAHKAKTSPITLHTKVETFVCDVNDAASQKSRISIFLDTRDILSMNSVLLDDLSFFFGGRLQKACIMNVGNPHLVLFLNDYTMEEVSDIGAQLTHHPFFKKGVNIGFVKMPDDSTIIPFPGAIEIEKKTPSKDISSLYLSVFERGVGPTPACGTGAYAACLAATSFMPISPQMIIQQEGGDLIFDRIGTKYKVTGEASLVFHGTFYI